MSKSVMQMCADEIAGYLKRIADLENQLQDWQDGTIIAQWQDCEQKVKELEKQLAEKEKEIETIQENSDKNIDYLIEFASLIEDQKDCNRMLKALERVRTGKKYIVDKEHQDKISFCIEKLEWVQKLLIDNAFNELRVVLGEINNQIEELKKEIK